MITLLELNTLIAEAKENMEECRKSRNAALSFGNKPNADRQQKEGKKWLSKIEFYTACIAYIETSSAEVIEGQRNMLMPKISTIEQRVFNDLWSRMPTDEWGRKPKPDLKNPVTKKQYDELSKPYHLPVLKKQLRTLNFILK
ncbi:MAG: hypothetical protein QN716_01650 [Nitrososphaeraceae archaeon]|nr:hypothetical protein [Nitrososphaeraceae archaeon]